MRLIKVQQLQGIDQQLIPRTPSNRLLSTISLFLLIRLLCDPFCFEDLSRFWRRRVAHERSLYPKSLLLISLSSCYNSSHARPCPTMLRPSAPNPELRLRLSALWKFLQSHANSLKSNLGTEHRLKGDQSSLHPRICKLALRSPRRPTVPPNSWHMEPAKRPYRSPNMDLYEPMAVFQEKCLRSYTDQPPYISLPSITYWL